MRQEYLRAAAEAYANINDHQSDCYHYLTDGFATDIQARLSAAYSSKLAAKPIRKKYINKVVCTALAECQYPANNTTGQIWNAIERSAFAGIAKQTWSDNNLSDYVDFILNDMSQNAAAARAAIQLQVVGY
ncbi:hypothetical protein [Psychrobacter pacificensis]|uniref:hypothetical protein n=1 Tax=Psychrobacter pacificensis TaxID=112002 RepID=UPI001CBC443A|nr:hypothetical protein [Psychrobacter pacificensis]MBZ1392278.1 hypothetical protein [Psychrobacter pacificensis]